ncbi:MAG TPA: flavodoxin reductase [Prolixibacteraceae bacterium]|nr:flavodoxin reductase [Prolixibacteraceae bacterium]
MENHLVKIKSIKHITPDVLQIVTQKPDNYTFAPGQATEIAINKTGWKDEKRPFTFTSLPIDDFLQFTIKTYPSHKGVTNELLQAKKDDELILHDVFGAIAYQGEGLFIAGGAGVTPFISIFRYLQLKNEIRGNKLIFANKTKEDIILAIEFEEMLGENFINILSEERTADYAYGQIDEEFLKANIAGFNQQFYVCGPPPMMDAVEKQLANLGVAKKAITVEEI